MGCTMSQLLELIAKGLKGVLLLVPQEKLLAVKAILENSNSEAATHKKKSLSDNPWQGINKLIS